MKKIKKTMIYMEEAEHWRLRHLALDTGVSMAELIRRAIADYLKRHPRTRKAVRS
jgi:Ribbon-helix-helix protein, copG family